MVNQIHRFVRNSSFHRYVRQGVYPEYWGGKAELQKEESYGEPLETVRKTHPT